MKKNNLPIVIFVVVAISGALLLFFVLQTFRKGLINSRDSENISSFEECVAAGNPVLESYTEQCRTSEGKSFTRNIGNEMEVRNLIVISNPRPNQEIGSPVEISGEAVGTWYFEGTFPIELQDDKGQIIAQNFASSQGEWMTEEFVPFTTKLTFEKPKSSTGLLILRNDNPSGLSENDKQLVVPVIFK